MNDHEPSLHLMKFCKSVGHYCSLDSALKILEARSIRFSPLSNMNDPWESRKRRFGTLKPTCTEQEKMACAVDSLADAVNLNIKLFCGTHNWCQPEFEHHILNPWQAPGAYDDPVGSFSTKDFDSRHFNQPTKFNPTDALCWARMRMWDHYGHQRQGACLVFDRDELAKSVHDSFPLSCSGHVFYTSGSQRLTTRHSRVFQPTQATDDCHDAIRHHIDFHIKDLAMVKDGDWSNENEFRVVVYDTSSTSFVDVEFGTSLKAIVLGLDVEPTLIPAALRWANGIPIFRTEWDDNFGRMNLGSLCE